MNAPVSRAALTSTASPTDLSPTDLSPTDLSPTDLSPTDLSLDAERSQAFKAAMRHLVGGVSIVTAFHGTEQGGLAATSVTSFSADPPSLLVSVNQSASAMPLIRRSRRFAVSILGHDHEAIADRFAGRDGSKGAARFAGANWVGRPGYPQVLADAIASFECEIEEMIDRFSHTAIIGRVTEARARGGDGALVYWRAAYDRIGAIKPTD